MKSGSSIEIDDLGNNLEHPCGSFAVLRQHCISHLVLHKRVVKSLLRCSWTEVWEGTTSKIIIKVYLNYWKNFEV